MSKRGKVPPQRPGKAGGKRARNRQQRTDALIEAGLQLFLERGVENVPIDDIAREAGMAKGNFYRYFDDKGALVDAILGDVAADVRTAMRKCAVSLGRAETSAEMNDAYGEYFGSHPPCRRCYGVTLQAGMLVEAAFVAEFPPQ